MRRQTVLRTWREERRGQNRQAEVSPGGRHERRQDGVPEACGRAPSGNRAFARPDRRYCSDWVLCASKAARAAIASDPRAVAGVRPFAARTGAASRAASWVRLDRCRPIVAPLSRAIERARSSAAPRDPATSSTSPSRARSRTKRRASASRISLAEDSISLTWERSAWVGLCCIELLPDAVPGHRDRPRAQPFELSTMNYELRTMNSQLRIGIPSSSFMFIVLSS